MGRIKPPSGKIFRRESKPGYMELAKAQEGKNWNITLDDTIKLMGAAEQVYTSPLLRDAVGGVAEFGKWAFHDAWVDDEEPTVEEAAQARVTAAQPPSVAPGPDMAAPAAPPAAQPQVPAAAPAVPTPAAAPAPTLPPLAAVHAGGAKQRRAGDEYDTRNRWTFEDGDVVVSDEPINYQQAIQRKSKGRATLRPAVKRLVDAGLGNIGQHLSQGELQKFTDYYNFAQEQLQGEHPPDAQPVLPDRKDLILWNAARELAKQEPYVPPEEPTAVLTPGELTLDPTEIKSRVQALYNEGTMPEGDWRLARRALARGDAAEAEGILGKYTKIIEDTAPEAAPEFEAVPPPEAAPAPVPEAAPAPVPAAAAPAPAALPGYFPAPAERVLTKPQLRGAAQWLTTHAAADPLAVRDMLGMFQSDPTRWETMLAEAEDPQQFMRDLLTMQEAMRGQLAPPAPAPTVDVSAYKIKDGMNLGQAQAMAAGLALAGGSQADLAAMMEDVGNITGVSSVGGGFGRWVSGGRKGGYFMDPGAAAVSVKKAYDAALKARQQGRSAEIMNALRRVQMQKAAQSIPLAIVKEQRMRSEAASKQQKRAVETAAKIDKAIRDAQKHNAYLPIDTYKKVLDASQKALDLAKDLKKSAYQPGPAGDKIFTQDLRRYQGQLNTAANALENFTRSNASATNNHISRLDQSTAKLDTAEGQQEFLAELDSMKPEQIVQLYGSDMKAYKRDLRKAEVKPADVEKVKKAIAARQEQLRKRQGKIANLRKDISDISNQLAKLLTDSGSKKDKKSKLDALNSLLENKKDELTELLTEE